MFSEFDGPQSVLLIVGEHRWAKKTLYIFNKAWFLPTDAIKIPLQLPHLICYAPKISRLPGAPAIAVSKFKQSFLMWRLHHKVRFMLQQKEASESSQNNRQTAAEKKTDAGLHDRTCSHCVLGKFNYSEGKIWKGRFWKTLQRINILGSHTVFLCCLNNLNWLVNGLVLTNQNDTFNDIG